MPWSRPVLTEEERYGNPTGKTVVVHEPILDEEGNIIPAETHPIQRVAQTCEKWVVNTAADAGLPLPRRVGKRNHTPDGQESAYVTTDVAKHIETRAKQNNPDNTDGISVETTDNEQGRAEIFTNRRDDGVVYISQTQYALRGLELREALEAIAPDGRRAIDNIFDMAHPQKEQKNLDDKVLLESMTREEQRFLDEQMPKLPSDTQAFINGLDQLTPEQQEIALSMWPQPDLSYFPLRDLRQNPETYEEVFQQWLSTLPEEQQSQAAKMFPQPLLTNDILEELPEEDALSKPLAENHRDESPSTERGRLVSDTAYSCAQSLAALSISQAFMKQDLIFDPQQGELMQELANNLEQHFKQRQGSFFKFTETETGNIKLECRENKLENLSELYSHFIGNDNPTDLAIADILSSSEHSLY